MRIRKILAHRAWRQGYTNVVAHAFHLGDTLLTEVATRNCIAEWTRTHEQGITIDDRIQTVEVVDNTVVIHAAGVMAMSVLTHEEVADTTIEIVPEKDLHVDTAIVVT